jgi:hypothetical protein
MSRMNCQTFSVGLSSGHLGGLSHRREIKEPEPRELAFRAQEEVLHDRISADQRLFLIDAKDAGATRVVWSL